MFEKFNEAHGFSFVKNHIVILKTSLLLFLVTAHFYAVGQNAQPVFDSYEVNTDNAVIFRYLAPNAKEVKLNSQLTATPQPMTKDEKGIWTVKIGPVKQAFLGKNNGKKTNSAMV